MDVRRMLDLHRRLAVAVPRLRAGRRPPRGRRLRRARRVGRLARRARPSLRAPRREPGGLGHPRRTTPPARRSGSSAPTPTAPTSGSSRTPTPGGPATGSSPSRCTAARSSTRGSTATSGCPVGSWSATATGPTERLLLVDRPLFRVPQLAIHLDREITTNGLLLNAQQHLSPVWGLGDVTPGAFAAFVADAARRRRRPPSSAGTSCSTTSPRARSSGRRRARVSAPASTTSARAGPGSRRCSPVTADDARAPGPDPAARAVRPRGDRLHLRPRRRVHAPARPSPSGSCCGLGGGRDEHLRALAGSVCCSADMAHATHPNYADKHEPGPPDRAQRRSGAQGEQQRALRQRRAELGGPRARLRAGRRAAAALRPPQRPALRLHHRSDHRRRAWASPPSTSAPRSSPCTRAGSCAAPTTRRATPRPWPRSSRPRPDDGGRRGSRRELGLGPTPTWTEVRVAYRAQIAASPPRPRRRRRRPRRAGHRGLRHPRAARTARVGWPTTAPAAPPPPPPPRTAPPRPRRSTSRPRCSTATRSTWRRRPTRRSSRLRRGVPPHRRRHLHRSVLRHPRDAGAASRARACAAS